MGKMKSKYIPLGSWQEYEREKQKIVARNLSPDEYEAAIAELIERLAE